MQVFVYVYVCVWAHMGKKCKEMGKRWSKIADSP